MQAGQTGARVELGGPTFEVGPRALLHPDESHERPTPQALL